MIIEKNNSLFSYFNKVTVGTVFSTCCNGASLNDIHMKIEAVITNSGIICNEVNLETGEWGFFSEDEPVVSFINAKVVLEQESEDITMKITRNDRCVYKEVGELEAGEVFIEEVDDAE